MESLIASTSVTREQKGKNVSLYYCKSFLHRFIIVRFCSSSRSIPLPLKSLIVSHRALCQVLQRVLSRLIACRCRDALHLCVREYTWCVHMAEAGNRTASDAGCRGRDAVPCAPRVQRTSTLTRGALPGRGLKSDRRRRRLYVAPRERRRDDR